MRHLQWCYDMSKMSYHSVNVIASCTIAIDTDLVMRDTISPFQWQKYNFYIAADPSKTLHIQKQGALPQDLEILSLPRGIHLVGLM